MTPTRKAIVAGLAFFATPLLAAPQDTIGTRIAGYRAMGAAFKSANEQLRSGEPQAAALKSAAEIIVATSRSQYGWFPAGSGPAPGVKTQAKAEIWSQPAEFKAAQDKFAVEAGAFSRAVATGKTDAIAAQAKQLGAACSACHRVYRSDAKS